MQSLQSIPIAAELDPALTGRIGPHQELHLLQMTRELLSNALRHSGASQVRIALRALPDGLAQLEIADDGSGFDPVARTGTGRGLLNLAARAREIDAQLGIESAPGKGARITVRFSPVV
jgi:signal transduction histidine kinase